MSFFQWNFLVLSICALIVYLFFRENVKARIYENIFLVIYAPILSYIYLNSAEHSLAEVQLSIFVLLSFEIFSIIKIYNLFKSLP